MAIFFQQPTGSPSIQWSQPLGKLDIEETSTGTDLNFTFHFALPIVELLALGVDEFSFAIVPSSGTWSYDYFQGDIDSMEDDINEFFANQYSIDSEKDPEYSSYYYTKRSLANFVSDKILSEIKKAKSALEVFNHAVLSDKQSTYSPSALAAQVPNAGNFLHLTSLQEPSIDLTKFPNISTANSFKEYFRDLAGVYSKNPLEIGNVEFIKNLTNESVKGNLSFTSEDRISVEDKTHPMSFWSLWQKLFNWSSGDSENILAFGQYSEPMFPCKVSGTMHFESTANRVLVGLFLRENLKLKIDFFKNGESAGIQSIEENLNLLTMIKQASLALEKPQATIMSDGFSDRVSIYNPNKFSLNCVISCVRWHNENKNQTITEGISMKIGPRSSDYIDFGDNTGFPSRYYQVNSYHGFWSWFLDLSTDQTAQTGFSSNYPSEQIPWTTSAGYIPGIVNIIDPLLGDPQMGCYSESSTVTKVVVSNISPYIDKIKYYIKDSIGTGAGAMRAPGNRRHQHSYISCDPIISDGYPTGELVVNTTTLAPGSYEIVADLYSKGTVVDTLNTVFYKDSLVGAAAHGKSFTVQVSPGNTALGSTLKVNETGTQSSDISSDIVNQIIQGGTLPSPLGEVFNETWAESTSMSTYVVTRFNYGNSKTELLAAISANTPVNFPPGDSTTPNHAYVVSQYVASAGQILATNSPSTTTANQGLDIVFDFAKFRSQQYLKTQTLPSLSGHYMLQGQDAWPALALAASSTAVTVSSMVTRSSVISTTLVSISSEYDQLRRINRISWSVTWSDLTLDSSFYPRYYLLLAKYGGVTSPIAYTFADSSTKSLFSIGEKTMAGAMGTVVYSLYCIYIDGSISNELGSTSITHTSDLSLRLTTGIGL